MKRVLLLFAVLAVVGMGCSTNKGINPLVMRGGAQGTPDGEGDGGSGGSGGSGSDTTIVAVDANGEITGDDLVIPINLTNVHGTAKGFQVTFTLSSGLRLNGTPSAACSAGTYLTGCGDDSNPIFWAGYNADSSITIIAALNPGKCASCNTGVLFNVDVTLRGSPSTEQYFTLVPSPSGAVTPSPTINDCSNQPTLVRYGNTVATITF